MKITIKKALNEIATKSLCFENEDRRWALLAIILGEIFNQHGHDLEAEIENPIY